MKDLAATRKEIFQYMMNEHATTLLESDINQIIGFVIGTNLKPVLPGICKIARDFDTCKLCSTESGCLKCDHYIINNK